MEAGAPMRAPLVSMAASPLLLGTLIDLPWTVTAKGNHKQPEELNGKHALWTC